MKSTVKVRVRKHRTALAPIRAPPGGGYLLTSNGPQYWLPSVWRFQLLEVRCVMLRRLFVAGLVLPFLPVSVPAAPWRRKKSPTSFSSSSPLRANVLVVAAAGTTSLRPRWTGLPPRGALQQRDLVDAALYALPRDAPDRTLPDAHRNRLELDREQPESARHRPHVQGGGLQDRIHRQVAPRGGAVQDGRHALPGASPGSRKTHRGVL